MTTAPSPIPSGARLAAVLALCASPTILAVATLPIYGPSMDDAGLIPILYAAFYGAPAVALAIGALGFVGARLAKDAARRAKHRATMVAAAVSVVPIAAAWVHLLILTYAT
jgi:chromate transport protein ChrA